VSKIRHFSVIIMALTGILFFFSCGKSDDGAKTKTLQGELSTLHLDKYIDAVPYTSHEPYASDESWEIYYFDASVCKCVTGNPFHVEVKTKEAAGNVVFLLDGGGACWPGMNACTTSANYIMDQDDGPGNPLNGWNLVFVPYCDGSVHTGDNDADYDGDTVPDHFHRGLQTTTAAIAIMRDLFPNPPKILITGCSAGGYGTFMAYLLNRRFFPEASIYIFNDSGPGLWNPDNGMKQLISYAWLYEQYLPAGCSRCDLQLMYLYEWMLWRDPLVRIGLFSSYKDYTIGVDYLNMQQDDYKALLLSASGAVRLKYPDRFNRFLVNGDTHCIAQVPGGYTHTVGGVTILQWQEQLITDDPDWADILE
jgi:hypothetical protein